MAKGSVVGTVGMAKCHGIANGRGNARDGDDSICKRSHDYEFEAVRREACE